MVANAVVTVGSSVITFLLQWFFDLLPTDASWFQTGAQGMTDIGNYVGQFDYWIPTHLAFVCVLWIFALIPICGIIEIVRMAASFLTLGGGAT